MTRAKKIATGVGAFVLAAAVGIGIAAFVATAPVKGGASSSPFSVNWGPNANVVSSADMVCAVSSASGTLTLDVTKSYSGGNCLVRAEATLPSSNAEDGRVVGMRLSLPDGWNVTVNRGCGATLTRTTVYQPIEFTVRMTDTATAGGSSTFAPATDGLQVAPQSSNAPLQAGCA